MNGHGTTYNIRDKHDNAGFIMQWIVFGLIQSYKRARAEIQSSVHAMQEQWRH